MRVHPGPVVVSALTLALVAPAAARAQDPSTPVVTPPPASGVQTVPLPGPSAWVGAAPFAPELAPAAYASYMLPPSATHPWVILADSSRFGGYAATDAYRTSPYGDYSRYSYHRTGPFAGLPRPAVWYSEPHSHHRHQKCVVCP